MASEPDICILCVNFSDEVEFVKRTIAFLESYIDSKVIALVIFPVERNIVWSTLGNDVKKIDMISLTRKRVELENELNIKTYILDEEDDIEQLYKGILAEF